MPVVKAFHVIAMVAWFSGLFYLPRLFVYHADTKDPISDARFILMEKRLYWQITTPAAIITTFLGCWLWLPHYIHYAHAWWLHIKLFLVLGLWAYHIYCGILLKRFREKKNQFSSIFFRFFNEIPTLFLVSIILLVYLK